MGRRQLRAVVFAAILVSSMVAFPALQPEPARADGATAKSPLEAALQTDTSDSAQVGPNVTDPTLLPEERLAWSAYRVEQLDADGARQDALNDTVDHLDTSLSYYEAHRATDRQAFDSQYDALHALADATGGEHDATIENVSLGVIGTSNQTARIATRHANASATRFSNSLDQWDEDDVEQALTDARAALQRAENARDQIDEGWRFARQIRHRADTVDHYREANHHANRALDTVEENVEPRLRAVQGEAVELNGTVRVPVHATLTDVRPWTYDDASVVVESGNESRVAGSISFGDGWLATTHARGSTTIEVNADAENVTVYVRASDGAHEDRSVSDTLELDLSDVRSETPARPEGSANATVNHSGTGTTVAATGDGLIEEDVRVTDASPPTDQDYLDSDVVRITNRTAVDEATVTLQLDQNATAGASTHSIYTWDPSTNASWEPLETTFDRDAGTATASVEHFSYFAVMRDDRWEDLRSSTITLQDRHLTDPTLGQGSSNVGTVVRDSDLDGEPSYDAGSEFGFFVWQPAEDSLRIEWSGNTEVTDDARIVDVAVDADGPLDMTTESWASTMDFDLDPADDSRERVRATVRTGWDAVEIDVSQASEVTVDLQASEPIPNTEVESTSDSDWEQRVKSEPVSRMPSRVHLGADRESPDHLPLLYGNVTAGNAPTEGLLGHWPLDDADDGSVRDVSGNGNHGEFVGTGSEVTEVAGPFGTTAFDFNGTDAHVEIPSTDRLSGGSDARFTGSVWVAPRSGSRVQGIFGKDGAGSPYDADWALLHREDCPDNDASNPICTGESPYIGFWNEESGGDHQLLSGPVAHEQWYHLAFTLDQPNQTARLYVDGELVLEGGSGIAESANTTGPVRIGGFPYEDVGDLPFSGIVDDARVYDRVLNDSEVRSLATRGGGNVTRSVLRDSSGDGIPDAVADANPVIPELAPIHGEQYARINLSAEVPDTSGDGILDNETIDVDYRVFDYGNETKLEARVVDAEHHPGKFDTSGDGLPDWRQEQGWQIYYTNTSQRSEDYVLALQEAEDDEIQNVSTFDEHLVVENVTSDPMVADTRGNGLTDREEFDLTTHPRKWDTTGDGVDDADAVNFERVDPTLHDFQGPAIDVLSHGYERNTLSSVVDYDVSYSAFDPSGLEEGRALVDGEVKDAKELRGQNFNQFHSFQTSGLTSLNDALTGAEVTVQAEDSHGNVAEVVALERENIYGDAASNIGGDGLASRAAAGSFGIFAGVGEGAGDLSEFLAAFATNPTEFIPTIEQVIATVETFTDLEQLRQAVPRMIRQKQLAQNPFDPDLETQLYREFRDGWFAGYSAWLVLEMALPLSELGRIAKDSARLQRAVNRLDSSGKLVQTAKVVASVASTLYAPVRAIDYAMVRAITLLVRLPVKSAHRFVGTFRTVGSKRAAMKVLREGDDTTARVAADGSGELDDRFRYGLKSARSGDVVDSDQISRAMDKVDDLAGAQKVRAKRLVADAEGEGIRLIDELDDANLRRMVEMDDASGYDFSRWDQWRGNLARSTSDADPEDVNRYVEDVHKAGDNPDITDPRGLVDDLADPDPDPSDFRGQRGEAQRAVHYAEEVDEVRRVDVEPDDGDYDLRLKRTDGDEYVEVKTPADDQSLKYGWWNNQVDEMNKKYSNTDVSKEQAILEVPVKRSVTDLEFAEDELRKLLNTRVNKDFNEVRIRVRDRDGNTELITVSADPG